MEIVKTKIFLLLLTCWFSSSISAQSHAISLEDALIEVSIDNNLTLLFSQNIMPEESQINPWDKNLSINKILDLILKDSGLEYRIENDQIFLYKRRQIFGYISDHESKERLISAPILLMNTGKYIVTNDEGYFSFSSIEDSIQIQIQYLGYEKSVQKIHSQNMDQQFNIELRPNLLMEDIIIIDRVSNQSSLGFPQLYNGSEVLIQKNQAVSAIGGEPDINQSIIRQSGVTTGADGIGGIHMRGGKQDQNFVLYDGVPLYNASHALGMFSIFNTSILDQATVYKAGSSGKYSGRLSSVIDVKIKNPDLRKSQTSIQISSLASQMNLEVPIIQDKLGVLLSYRRTHFDPIINILSRRYYSADDQFTFSNYFFQDMNAKLHYKINHKHNLYLTYYRGNDSYFLTLNTLFDEPNSDRDLVEESAVRWRNNMFSLRWNTLINQKTIANYSLSRYSYLFNSQTFNTVYNNDEIENDFSDDFISENINLSLRIDFETILEKHHLKYGITSALKNYNPGDFESSFLEDYTEEIEYYSFDFPDYQNLETKLYINDKITVNQNLNFEGSVYFVNHNTIDPYNIDIKSFFDINGYLLATIKLHKFLHIGTSIGKYTQFEHLVSTSDAGLPNDVWFPSTQGIGPEISYQGELFSKLALKSHTLNLALFYKFQEGILYYQNDNSLPSLFSRDNQFWDEDVELGQAQAYGFELDYSYNYKNKYLTHLAYTYNQTDYQFIDINEGNAFPFSYSVPHTLVLGSNLKLNKNWYSSLDFFYHSGRLISLFSLDDLFSPLTLFESDVTRLSDINSLQLNDSYKLSFNVARQWQSQRITHELSLGIQNLTNKENEIYRYIAKTNDGTQEIIQQNSFPIMPMFRYKIRF